MFQKISRKSLDNVSTLLDFVIVGGALFTFAFWLTGKGLFYSESAPVMSPFTSFSLLLMAGSRLAERKLATWGKPMTLALLGIAACGNMSSIMMLMAIPDIFLDSMPGLVPTSIMTSVGLILFCFYEILVVLRKTPDSAFILDDILLHLALFPGGISLLGHVMGIPEYQNSGVDPRSGIGPMEMMFMGSYAVVAVLSNPNLFLWKFLSESFTNRIVFGLLFVNQYIAPVAVGVAIHGSGHPYHQPGVEFFVMLAGVLATLTFLVTNAVMVRRE